MKIKIVKPVAYRLPVKFEPDQLIPSISTYEITKKNISYYPGEVLEILQLEIDEHTPSNKIHPNIALTLLSKGYAKEVENV